MLQSPTINYAIKMKNFIETYRRFKELQPLGCYRLCYIPIGKDGNGFYNVIEFFDEELNKLDKNKVEIIVF